MNINEIEQAITAMSPDELTRFREWFEEYDAKIGDKQIDRDAESGKLNVLKSTTEDHLKKLQGSLKGKGLLKALMAEKKREREL